MKKLTILVGIGGSVPFGAKVANKLNDVLTDGSLLPAGDRKQRRADLARFMALLQLPAGNAWAQRAIGGVNFEAMLDFIEQCSTLYNAHRDRLEPPPSSLFTRKFTRKVPFNFWDRVLESPQLEPLLRWNTLQFAIQEIVETVADEIDGYCPAGWQAPPWFQNFLDTLVKKFTLQIVTLNYDTCIEVGLGQHPWSDGFSISNEGVSLFDLRSWRRWQGHRVCHLHGSVQYGFPQANPAVHRRERDFEELARYDNRIAARGTWFNRSQNRDSDRSELRIGPIVTGLRKPSRVTVLPYSAYFTALAESLADSPNLLVVGYSGGDIHLNRLMESATVAWGSERRAVVLDFISRQQRHPDMSVLTNYSPSLSAFWGTLTQMGGFTRPYRMAWDDPLISDDGYARLYFDGFQQVVENASRLDEIVGHFGG